MAISVNDVLQITDVQNYLGQTILNVYFYRVDVLGSAITYQDVADYFQTQIVLPVADIQSDQLTHSSTMVKNLTNGLDIFEDPIIINGTDVNAIGPSFVAASFRLLRSTAATRHGSKRVGGLTENFYTGNSHSATYNVGIAAIEDALGSPVEVDSAGDLDLTMSPVIVGRFPKGSPNEGELDLSVINPVSSCQFIRVSTQTTRRAGRGV